MVLAEAIGIIALDSSYPPFTNFASVKSIRQNRSVVNPFCRFWCVPFSGGLKKRADLLVWSNPLNVVRTLSFIAMVAGSAVGMN